MAIFQQDAEQDAINSELEGVDEYKMKFFEVKHEVEETLEQHRQRTQRPEEQFAGNGTLQALNQTLENFAVRENKQYNLPKVNLHKFSGDVKQWLKFWGLFKPIHDNGNLTDEQKFQYLTQSMVKESRAADLVNSYPATAENYPKAIEALKNRFGKDELIIEVYIRELLRLVLNNTQNTQEKAPLSSLFDKLETQLRALETLGVTSAMYTAMLYPLVESALPGDVLRAYQRNHAPPNLDSTKQRLDKLMEFLQAEVDSEERIAMAKSGFGPDEPQKPTGKVFKEKPKKKKDAKPTIASAAGLLNIKESSAGKCIFCEGGHESPSCKKAREMTLEQRQAVVKQKNACFNCLIPGHGFKTCRYKGTCGWCGRKHVFLMCRLTMKTATDSDSSEAASDKLEEHSMANVSSKAQVIMQTLRVKLVVGGRERVVRAIVDTGSQHLYVTERLTDSMNCEVVGSQSIVHLLFGGVQSKPQRHVCYRVHVRNLNKLYACAFQVYGQETICSGVSTVLTGPWISELLAKGVSLSDVDSPDEPISLLIGLDVIGLLYTGQVIKLNLGPTAVETRLGWTLLGKTTSADESHKDSTLLTRSMLAQNASLSDLWKLDVLGTEDPIQQKTKVDQDREVLVRFRDNIKVNAEGRYEVELPWKENHPPLSDNRPTAEARLQRVQKKLRDTGLFDAYQKVLDEWLEQGIIEKVPSGQVDKPGFYLPHRPVVKENSTTPVRPVFDASVKNRYQPSLNQCLETGPNLIILIPPLITEFRRGRYGIIADVQKAFLQISITPGDRDNLRFLWAAPNPEVYRHCRVVFSVASSQFEKIIDEAQDEELLSALVKLKRAFYVDNCAVSVQDEEQIERFIALATEAMAKDRFNLRGWEHTGEEDSPGGTPMLGLTWYKKSDTLSLAISVLKQSPLKEVTKRAILSSAQKVFDPIGMVCPVLLRPKILLRKLWTSEVDWDAPLEGDVRDDFVQWQRDLTILQDLRMPRWCYGPPGAAVSLHLFVDASKDAYAAVVFSRVEVDGDVEVHFVEAKSRLAPKEAATILRLELMAATIGARPLASVMNSLDPELKQSVECCCWSDSTTVLSWIQRQSQWAVFVCNRVQEIRKLTRVESWRHVPGQQNPADVASRGCPAQQLMDMRWWEGPRWLRDVPETWPKSTFKVNEQEVDSELRKTPPRARGAEKPDDCVTTQSGLNKTVDDPDEGMAVSLFNRVSKYSIGLRTMAYVKRFAANCRRPRDSRLDGPLTAKEVKAAEIDMLQLSQKESFSGSKDRRLASMTVIEETSGLLRLRSVVENRPDSLAFRRPIILDNRHIMVQRLIEYTHRHLNHAQTDIVMSTLRERFWILCCRRVVSSIVRRCVTCKGFNAQRMETEPAALPENRVGPAGVFEVVGMDYAGPLFLEDDTKVWVCLFTCAVYRAVHFELVSSLSTQRFIKALRRFINRRGRPIHVYTDNGTNFCGAQRALRKINWKRALEDVVLQEIEWHSNPPSAPWWGGWWERLVRSVKELLRKILKRTCLDYEEMITVLSDCERVINSRPLTYLAEDPEQLTPLTPKMFLQERTSNGVTDLDAVDAAALNKQQGYRQELRDHLRRRFRSEYLAQLAQRRAPARENRSVDVGDVVLIGSDQEKRLDWPLGKIVQLFPGRDGVVRVAKVKTMKGELLRPLQRLYPLEVSSHGSEIYTCAARRVARASREATE